MPPSRKPRNALQQAPSSNLKRKRSTVQTQSSHQSFRGKAQSAATAQREHVGSELSHLVSQQTPVEVVVAAPRRGLRDRKRPTRYHEQNWELNRPTGTPTKTAKQSKQKNKPGPVIHDYENDNIHDRTTRTPHAYLSNTTKRNRPKHPLITSKNLKRKAASRPQTSEAGALPSGPNQAKRLTSSQAPNFEPRLPVETTGPRWELLRGASDNSVPRHFDDLEQGISGHSALSISDTSSEGDMSKPPSSGGSRTTDIEFITKLINRNANPNVETRGDPLADELLEAADRPTQREISESQRKELLHFFTTGRANIKRSQRDDLFHVLESCRKKLDDVLNNYGLYTMLLDHFDEDRNLCRKSNEAMLQRTLFLDILDRFHFTKEYMINCEATWYKVLTYPMPSTQPNDKLKQQVPDMAIYFKCTEFKGNQMSIPYLPDNLQECVAPDADVHRWFPFMSFEAKRRTGDLEVAHASNMSTASQALYNMYQCLRAARKEQTFFDEVRTFSISLNAEHAQFRIHRARPNEDEDSELPLHFLFQEFQNLYDYRRDRITNLIQGILREYGPRLRGILKETYDILVEQGKRAKMHPPHGQIQQSRSSSQSAIRRARNNTARPRLGTINEDVLPLAGNDHRQGLEGSGEDDELSSEQNSVTGFHATPRYRRQDSLSNVIAGSRVPHQEKRSAPSQETDDEGHPQSSFGASDDFAGMQLNGRGKKPKSGA